jgi:hypothetical protein
LTVALMLKMESSSIGGSCLCWHRMVHPGPGYTWDAGKTRDPGIPRATGRPGILGRPGIPEIPRVHLGSRVYPGPRQTRGPPHMPGPCRSFFLHFELHELLGQAATCDSPAAAGAHNVWLILAVHWQLRVLDFAALAEARKPPKLGRNRPTRARGKLGFCFPGRADDVVRTGRPRWATTSAALGLSR